MQQVVNVIIELFVDILMKVVMHIGSHLKIEIESDSHICKLYQNQTKIRSLEHKLICTYPNEKDQGHSNPKRTIQIWSLSVRA
jgi:hypothetical protein